MIEERIVATIQPAGKNAAQLPVTAGTPPDIVDRLHKGVAQIMHAPAYRAEVMRLGSIVGGNTPDEFAALVRADRARTGKLLAEAGITPE